MSLHDCCECTIRFGGEHSSALEMTKDPALLKSLESVPRRTDKERIGHSAGN